MRHELAESIAPSDHRSVVAEALRAGDRVRVQERDIAAWVHRGHRAEVLRLIVNGRHHPEAPASDLADHRGLPRRDRDPFGRREEQLRVEPNAVLATDRVERLERLVAHPMRSSGVQGDVGVGLELEPADHAEHALVRLARRQDRLPVPQV